MNARGHDWCILRCSNCKTLELARSLTDAGFEAWSPVEIVSRRARSGTKREETTLPLMASFVFAKADRLDDLIALSHSPTLNYIVWDSELRRMVTRGHPYFRLFRPNGDLRLIPDSQLGNLRKRDQSRRPRGKPREFAKGTPVRFTEGSFEGLYGVVEECRGGFATVTISDWAIPAHVATWLLQPALDEPAHVHVSGTSSERALFAQAA